MENVEDQGREEGDPKDVPVCAAGDTVKPGETCRYPGTEFEFSIDASGVATLRLGEFIFSRGAGGTIRIEDLAVDGVIYNFVATGNEDGSWLLLEVAGQTHTPAESSEEPVAAPDSPDSDAPVIEVGASVAGGIEAAGERDWFAVALKAGHAYRIDLEGDGEDETALKAPYLHGVHDVHGNPLTGVVHFGGGEARSMAFTPPADGTYYIFSAGFGGGTGNYRLSVTGEDFPHTTQTSGVVEVGGSATGEVNVPGDEDWFRVTLKAGQIYRIRLEGDGDGDSDGDSEGDGDGEGTLNAPHLVGIHDVTGRALGFAEGQAAGGARGQTVFSPDADGVYYLAAAGFEGATGTYTLSVEGYSDDFADNTETSGKAELASDPNSAPLTPLTPTGQQPADPPPATDEESADPGKGEIGTPGDRDWFAITLTGGQAYRIDLEGADTEAGTLQDPYLDGAYDADGNPVEGAFDDNSGAGRNSRLVFTPDADGTYYLSAAGQAGETGTYTLSLGEYSDDYPAGTETAGELTSADSGPASAPLTPLTPVGQQPADPPPSTDEESTGSVEGEIGAADDSDWFAVTLKGGQAYRIDLEGADTQAGTLEDPYLEGVYDADGNPVAGASDDNGGVGRNSRLVFTPDADGTYYLSAAGWAGETGAYTLSLAEYADDYPASTETAGEISSSDPAVKPKIPLRPPGEQPADPPPSTEEETLGSAEGEIGAADDSDWFAVTLKGGQTYRIDLEGADTDAGTLEDPYLEGVYDADGNPVAGASDDNGGVGRNSRLAFTPDADGTYYLSAAGFAGGTGTYTLSLDEYADDFADSTETSGQIGGSEPTVKPKIPLRPPGEQPADPPPSTDEESSGSAKGEIGVPGDKDWFALTLTGGIAYRIDLEGADSGQGTLENPHLYGIYDTEGNPVAGVQDIDGGDGRNSRLIFTPETDGTWYVSAAGFAGETGTYTLSVAEYSGGWLDTAQTIRAAEVGGLVNGEIEATGQWDWFTVELKAGQAYRLEVSGADANQGTLKAPFLEGVYDADGNAPSGVAGIAIGGGGGRIGFTPESDGMYYVRASAHGGTGSYVLSVEEYADDHGQATDAAGALEPGGSAAGEVGIPGDVDWFAVTLKGGQAYRIRLQGEGADHGALQDPHLDGVYDASGSRIFPVPDSGGAGDSDGVVSGDGAASSDGVGDSDAVTPNSGLLVFTPDADGTYYLSAAGFGSATGAYRLSVEEYADDYGDTQDTAAALEAEGPVAGEIGAPGDKDWFSVALKGGQTYRIELEGSATGQGALQSPHLEGVYDSEGHRVFPTADSDDVNRNPGLLVFTPKTDGTYYLPAAGTGSATGTYTLSVRSDDASDATDTSGTVELDDSVSAEIGVPGDKDWFAVMLEAAKAYRVDVEGSDTDQGTLQDPLLDGIYDADGNLVAATSDDNSGVGANGLAVFTPGAGGTYYVSAAASANQTGTYTVSVREHSDDYPADKETTGVLQEGDPSSGEIGVPGDVDWFAVTLTAGDAYRIDLKGSDSSNGTLGNPRLEGIYDAAGNLIADTADDNSGVGADSRVSFTPAADGAYYVSVAGFENDTGSYSLALVRDDFPETKDTGGRVEVGASAAGEIEEHGDRDWFAVTLKAGQAYRITLEGREAVRGALEDPYLAGIHDSDGNRLADTSGNATDAGVKSLVLFTPDADGTYYVSVAGYGGATGAYSLTVEQQADDSTGAGQAQAGEMAAAGGPGGGPAAFEFLPGMPDPGFADPADVFAAEDLMESFVLAIEQGFDLA